MKRNVTLVTLLVLAALLLAACGGTNEPALAGSSTERTTGSSLDTYYENALALRNQLALGTLRLEEADWPVTGGQASELLLLWQALRGTIGNGASAPAELDALQEQIERVMTTEQLAAIGAMRLTQADLQAWVQGQGLTAGTGQGGGMGLGQPSGGQSLSPEERATRQAERGGSGNAGSGISQALIDAVIALLETR